MKVNSNNIMLVIILIVFLLILCICDKFYYKVNKKNIENFEIDNYKKLNETVVLNSFLEKYNNVNLEQCKKKCSDDDKCLGFSRNNIEDSKDGQCNLIYKIDKCINENKKPSKMEDYLGEISPDISDNYSNYTDYNKFNTFLKKGNIDIFNDSRLKCMELDVMVSLKHNKYPMDFIYQGNDSKLILEKIDKTDEDIDKVRTTFKVIKGLSGNGISFETERDNVKFYVINRTGSEEVKLEQFEDNGDFKKNATFEIDLKYSAEANLFSIRRMNGNNDLYWKVNQINKKIIMSNINEFGDDKSSFLFHLDIPLIDNFNIKPLEFPAPSVEEPEITEYDIKKEKHEELEKLELEIREVQHKQNLKLMDVMLDVNKFKLMDLSMSDYLTKCNRMSSDNLIRVVPSASE